MPIVYLEDVKPGMILDEAVRNHQDLLLLDAGRRISAKSIRIFKSWGIRRLPVRSLPDGGGTGEVLEAPGLPPGIDAGLKERFADVAGDSIMEAIMQAARRQLAARSPTQKSPHGRS